MRNTRPGRVSPREGTGHERDPHDGHGQPRGPRSEARNQRWDPPGPAPRGPGAREPAAGTEDIGHLLLLASGGDQLAWNRLVDRLSPLLWSICRSFGLGQADAADAFQLTWLRLLEHLNAIDDPARLPGWLGTTCRRECLAILRRNKRAMPTDDERLLDRFGEPAGGADQPVLVSDRDAGLWRAFGRLDVRCQDILRILLVEPDGGRVSYELAAAALGMPLGSLGPTRGRCLNRLRTLLEAEGIRGPLGDS